MRILTTKRPDSYLIMDKLHILSALKIIHEPE